MVNAARAKSDSRRSWHSADGQYNGARHTREAPLLKLRPSRMHARESSRAEPLSPRQSRAERSISPTRIDAFRTRELCQAPGLEEMHVLNNFEVLAPVLA
jgi:hypothetical protein